MKNIKVFYLKKKKNKKTVGTNGAGGVGVGWGLKHFTASQLK